MNEKTLSASKPLEELIANSVKSSKKMPLLYSDVEKLKETLKNSTKNLWNYLQTKEKSNLQSLESKV